MSAKQKIVHGRGLPNLNLGIFVCSFDVCRASKPVPSINYDLIDVYLVITLARTLVSFISFLPTYQSSVVVLRFLSMEYMARV